MEQLKVAIKSGKAPAVIERLDTLLKEGHQPQALLDAMIESVRLVGEAFSRGEAFIPEMLIAAKAMQAGVLHMSPAFAKDGIKKVGKIMIGTVAGDLHDVGKNLVSLVFQGNGFEVIDLGVDLPLETFLSAYELEKPDLVGLSALLTTTMSAMEMAVRALKTKYPQSIVMVGGAPITQEFADRIGADGFAPDAAQAVTVAKRILGIA